LVQGAAPFRALVNEIELCEVVCANCHRRRTARRAGWRRLNAGEAGVSQPTRPQRNAQWVYEQLSKSVCVDCLVADTLVLEHDHRSDKRASVMRMVWEGYGLETIRREIAQCEVRCCNCHRRRHSESATFEGTTISST